MEAFQICVAFLIRMLFIFYGLIHDQTMEVKFTDIDYAVFTDGARYVSKGESPYLKSTYKYTPLLAYMLIPNITLHVLFGKVLFCIFDVAVAYVLNALLKEIPWCQSSLSNILINTCWLFNPFTMTISSRGNAESFQMLIVLLTLLFVMKKNPFLAGLFYGLSINFKIYPVIYSISFLMFISSWKQHNFNSYSFKILNIIKSVLCLDNILFATVSLVVFCSLGCWMYFMYGVEFIENAYLYHLARRDMQHNFSPYFYILRISQDLRWSEALKILAFLPQLVVVILIGFKYHKQLPLACFLQTFAFVSLNKVCTSQYFVWYIGLFPLAYPYLRIPLKKCIIMITYWLVGQAIWLSVAYLLEFKKYDVTFYVWLASVLFLSINMALLKNFVRFADYNIGNNGKTDKNVKED